MTEGNQLNVSKKIIAYYNQVQKKDYTEKVYKDWIDSISEPIKSAFQNKGFEQCKGVLNFQRFILELKNIDLDEYLKNKLTTEEYDYYTRKSK